MYNYLCIGEGAGFRALFLNIKSAKKGALISFGVKNIYSIGKPTNNKPLYLDRLSNEVIGNKLLDNDIEFIFLSPENDSEDCIKTLVNLISLRFKNNIDKRINVVCFGIGLLNIIKNLIYIGFKNNNEFISFVEENFVFTSASCYRSFSKIQDNEICLNRYSFVWMDNKLNLDGLLDKNDNLYLGNSDTELIESDIVQVSSLFFVSLKYLSGFETNASVLNDESLRPCLAKAIFEELSGLIGDKNKALELCASIFNYLINIENYAVTDLFLEVLPSLKRVLNLINDFNELPHVSFILACLAVSIADEKKCVYQTLSSDMDPESLSYAFFSDSEGLNLNYDCDSFEAINKSISDIQIIGLREAVKLICSKCRNNYSNSP